MNKTDEKAFFRLFQEAHEKCFWQNLNTPLSDKESKHFSNEIFERTGLIIGWKSIRNYSSYLLNPNTAKQEIPTTADLDTLARYIRNASKTNEATRKKNEAHFSYWHSYRDSYARALKPNRKRRKPVLVFNFIFWDFIAIIVLLITVTFYLYRNDNKATDFTEDFTDARLDALIKKDWMLKAKDSLYWNKGTEKSGHLALYTLEGDNYPDTAGRRGIRNLLLREINNSCFSTEMHLSDFIPRQNGQQVGILLMEDTTFSSRSVRLSLSFHNALGGTSKPGAILLQTISSSDSNFSKPEEITHSALFSNDSTQSAIITKSLRKSALRIEKSNHTYRFLYATGETDLSAFKEIISHDLLIEPKYIGLFAIKGFTPNTTVIPAYIDSFSLKTTACQD